MFKWLKGLFGGKKNNEEVTPTATVETNPETVEMPEEATEESSADSGDDE